MKQSKMREQLAQAFIDSLNEGILPWHATWSSFRPQNAISGKNYRGINSFWLSLIGAAKKYKDPRWCTFKQANARGWNVKKGEHGAPVEFWSLYDKKTRKTIDQKEANRIIAKDESRKEDIILMSRSYTVFNGEQIEGIPEMTFESTVDIDTIRKNRDRLLENMHLGFREGGSEAYYTPTFDSITMPPEGYFHDTYGYMSTFLHECGHATGHESRLNRDLGGGFGTESYAKEELRAEIASAFTAQVLGLDNSITQSTLDNHKAYIQAWIQAIEDQPNELFAAIKDAEKISDYLIEKGEFLKEHDLEAQMDAPETDAFPSLESQISAAAPREMPVKPSYDPKTKVSQRLP